MGVTTTKECVNQSFSNLETGWAYFPIHSETRHGSSSLGTKIYEDNDETMNENMEVAVIFDRKNGFLDFEVSERSRLTDEPAFRSEKF